MINEEWFFGNLLWTILWGISVVFIWPFLKIIWFSFFAKRFSLFGKPKDRFSYPRNWWRCRQLKVFTKLLNSISKLIVSGRISFKYFDLHTNGCNNHTTSIQVIHNSSVANACKISNPWVRLLCKCILFAFITFFIVFEIGFFPGFWESDNRWIGFLGGGIVVVFLTLGREFYVERKQRLTIINYALQTLEAQRFIFLGFKDHIKKAEGEMENFKKSGFSQQEWKKLDYPFRSFPKQSVKGYKELAEKLIFIAANKKYNNIIFLLHDMAKCISELDHHIEYRNEKINEYRQKSIYGESINNKQFADSVGIQSESISKFLEELDGILAQIRRSLRRLQNFGKWYFFFSCKMEEPKFINKLEESMPPEDHLKSWLDTICPEE